MRGVMAVAMVGLFIGVSAPVADGGAPLVFVAGVHGCGGFEPSPSQGVLIDFQCPNGVIRPGASSGGCTLNFVMTDGDRYYIGTAGHCGNVGRQVNVAGIGRIGQIIYRDFAPNLLDWRDWGLIRIDEGREGRIDPTMVRWGGPMAPGDVLGVVPDRLELNVRAPLPGEILLQYGHGAGLGREDATKGRALVTVASNAGSILAVGQVGGGDSGSPVRIDTGEAAGIAVAYSGVVTGDNRGFLAAQCASFGLSDCPAKDEVCPHLDGACEAPFRPGSGIGLIVISRMDAALDAFEAGIGKDLRVISGSPPGGL